MTAAAPLPEARALPLLYVLFAALGLSAGAFQAVLADLAEALSLSPGPLGLALTIGGLASIPVMYLGGRLIDRHGVRLAILGGTAGLVAAYLLFAAAQGFWGVVTAFSLTGMAVGVYDVGMNAMAARWEAATGRRAMAWLHASFSGGAATGALLAGVTLDAGQDFRLVYLGVAAGWLGVLALGLLARCYPAVMQQAAAAAAGGVSLYRDMAVLSLGFVAFAGYYGESAMESWSALYLRDALGVTAFVGASGVAVFHVAMTAGRLGAGVGQHLVGRRAWLGVAGLLAALGTVVAVSTADPVVSIGGFLLVGLGLSAVAPLAFSLAGELAPTRVGEAAAVVTTVGYAGSLLAPGIVGALAERIGLGPALGTAVVGALAITGLSLRMRLEPLGRG